VQFARLYPGARSFKDPVDYQDAMLLRLRITEEALLSEVLETDFARIQQLGKDPLEPPATTHKTMDISRSLGASYNDSNDGNGNGGPGGTATASNSNDGNGNGGPGGAATASNSNPSEHTNSAAIAGSGLDSRGTDVVNQHSSDIVVLTQFAVASKQSHEDAQQQLEKQGLDINALQGLAKSGIELGSKAMEVGKQAMENGTKAMEVGTKAMEVGTKALGVANNAQSTADEGLQIGQQNTLAITDSVRNQHKQQSQLDRLTSDMESLKSQLSFGSGTEYPPTPGGASGAARGPGSLLSNISSMFGSKKQSPIPENGVKFEGGPLAYSNTGHTDGAHSDEDSDDEDEYLDAHQTIDYPLVHQAAIQESSNTNQKDTGSPMDQRKPAAKTREELAALTDHGTFGADDPFAGFGGLDDHFSPFSALARSDPLPDFFSPNFGPVLQYASRAGAVPSPGILKPPGTPGSGRSVGFSHDVSVQNIGIALAPCDQNWGCLNRWPTALDEPLGDPHSEPMSTSHREEKYEEPETRPAKKTLDMLLSLGHSPSEIQIQRKQLNAEALEEKRALQEMDNESEASAPSGNASDLSSNHNSESEDDEESQLSQLSEEDDENQFSESASTPPVPKRRRLSSAPMAPNNS